MSSKYAILFASLSAIACAACSGIEREPASVAVIPESAGASGTTVVSAEARHSNAPFVVRVNGPEQVPQTSGRMVIVAVVERQLTDPTPLRLEWKLPASVKLVEGRLSEEIVDTASSRIERRIIIEAPSIPAEDVLFSAEAKGAGWGARGEAAYRFGRPEPMLPQLPRERTPMTVKGGPRARPVMMPPPSGAR